MTNGVYVAYPLDQAGESLDWMYELIAEAEVELKQYVSWIFDPGDAFTVNPAAVDPNVAKINRHAHLQADAIIAFLPSGVASIGVPMEIDRAVRFGKNVAILTDATSWMLQYPGIGRNVQLYPLDKQGVDAATAWLSYVQPRDEDVWRSRDPLPVRVGENGRLPTRAYGDDAGLDLYVSEDVDIRPGETADIPCDIGVEFPAQTWGMVFGRSSAVRKRGLMVNPGIIDTGWRGDLFVSVTNIGRGSYRYVEVSNSPGEPYHTVQKGERIAQLILFHNNTARVEPVQVAELTTSERGTNGFGSSGT